MEFQVLGPLQVRVADRFTRIGAAKQRALLGVLLVHVNQVVSVDQLLEDVWGGRQPAGGVKTLRYHISKLRDVLEPDRSRGEEGVILLKAGGYVLRVEPDQVDAGRFEALAGEGAQLLTDGDAGIAQKSLREALGLWRGAAFEDFRYDGFAQGEIARLEEMRLLCLENRISADLEWGRHREVVGELRELTVKHPLREQLWGQLMVALYRSDQQAEALRAYQTARTVLGEELGIEPNTALQRLEEQILLHELPFEPPESEAPPTDNLPARTSNFIGRTEDIAEIEKLIAKRRLVTLTGFAGIGKTSLAIELARRLTSGYSDGVWLTELAPLTDPGYVVGEIATVFDVRAHPTRPLLNMVLEALASRSMLLIVDNCEHLLAEVARVVDALLAGCPTVGVLATSREPLRLPGEQIWRVPPLDLPAGDAKLSVAEAGEIEAVQLFVERAQQSQAGFELDDTNVAAVVTICRRLDGIPLAIELAAARLRLLSPHELLDRLDDQFAVLADGGEARPERQRTLRAAIEWSFDLLGLAERTLLRRLAVFRGGFTLDAVENVCSGDTVDPSEVLDGVGHLLDASLLIVKAGEPRRYGLLESVHQYAQGLLDDSGEETTLRGRHAAYYSELGPHDPEFGSAELDELLELSVVDYDNFRNALAWTVEAGDGDRALRLAVRLGRYWVRRGRTAEVPFWIPLVLELTAETPPTVERARILKMLTTVFCESGRRQDAAVVLDELQHLAEQLDDGAVSAFAWRAEASFEEFSDLRASQKANVASAGVSRGLRDPVLSVDLSNVGELAVDLGDFDFAAEVADELEELARTLDQPAAALALANILRGMLALYQGDLQTARNLLVEALGEERRLGRVNWQTDPLRYLVDVCLAAGDAEDAADWARQLIDLSGHTLNLHDRAKGYTILARAALRQGRFDEVVEAVAEALNIAVEVDDTWALALVLATVGQIAWADSDASRAAALHAGAETLRTNIGFVHPAPRARELENQLVELRTTLGPDAFNAAWTTGVSHSKEELVSRARRVLGV